MKKTLILACTSLLVFAGCKSTTNNYAVNPSNGNNNTTTTTTTTNPAPSMHDDYDSSTVPIIWYRLDSFTFSATFSYADLTSETVTKGLYWFYLQEQPAGPWILLPDTTGDLAIDYDVKVDTVVFYYYSLTSPNLLADPGTQVMKFVVDFQSYYRQSHRDAAPQIHQILMDPKNLMAMERPRRLRASAAK